MDITVLSTVYTQRIPTRILKGGSYLYAQSYFEASDYGIIALDPDTLEVLTSFSYSSDRITDFSVYSDSRIAVRSDKKLAILSFDGTSFSEICSVGIRSAITTGVTCNNDFAFVSCGSKIISLDITLGEIAQEFNVPGFNYVRAISCTDDYLFARKCSINISTYKLAAYEINGDYKTNPHGNIYRLDEIDSTIFDMDMGRLTVDSSLNIIETGLYTNRLVTFNGSIFTVVGDLTPFYPALEFVKHGNYYFTSPDTDLIILSRSGLIFTEEYNAPVLTPRPSYKCPGFDTYEFFSSRDVLGDGTGRNVSLNEIVP
jgi:hypothetical protein